MISSDCARAEITAGAVALGEASDAERDAYRRHISGCRTCLASLGGERVIERTMSLVAQAREAERWEPEVRITLTDRRYSNRRAWWFGLAAVATAVLVWMGVHALIPSGLKLEPARVAVEQRTQAARARTPVRAAAGHDLIVLHKVATLKRPPLEPAASPRLAQHPAPARVAPVAKAHVTTTAPAVVALAAPSQRDERSIGALRNVASAPPPPEHAESIAVLPATAPNRDVVPVGGESAIVPRPSTIAYYENAQGTTTFEVTVDERGVPAKCSVTKSSGYLVLDEAVCRAAMHAHYLPRIVNGRAVSGLYHDSITFASSGDQ